MYGESTGDYWREVHRWEWVWMVKTRTGTVIRHCKEDAVKAGESAKAEDAKFKREQKTSHMRQIEYLMDDMFPYYENMADIAKDLAMWADDYASTADREVAVGNR